MRRSLLVECAMLAIGIVVAGFAAYSQTAEPQKPNPSQSPPASLSPVMPVTDSAKTAEPGTKPVAAPVTSDFVLGPEDQIAISMWDEPKFNGGYTIRPDGKIMVPLIGEIQAAGLTPLQLQASIDKAASSLLRTPRSTVNVTGVHSKHVYFDGEGIAGPGSMDLVLPLHVLEGISARGGFKDFADKKHIKILRNGRLFVTVNYKDLVSGKHPELNVLLQDQDHVVVN